MVVALFCSYQSATAQVKARTFSTASNKTIYTGNEEISSKSDESIFSNALLWCIDKAEKGKENILKADFKALNFISSIEIQTNSEDVRVYSFQMKIKVKQSHIVILVDEIKAQINNGFFKAFVPVEKLAQSDKPQDLERYKGAENAVCAFIEEFVNFVKGNTPDIKESNWEKVCEQVIKVGMTEDECKLICGKPLNIQNDVSRQQWMISESCYLIFENKVLTVVLD